MGRITKSEAAEKWWNQPRSATQAEYRAEQDRAAGGNERRLARLSDGRIVSVSIGLKSFFRYEHGYQLYAYLRFQDGPRTQSKYICNAVAPSRDAALKNSWREARRRGVLEKTGAQWVAD